VLFVKGGMKTV